MNPAKLPAFECKYALLGHTKAINSVKLSRDATRLLSGADDNLIIVWNLKRGSEEQRISVAFNGAVSAIAWTPTSESRATDAFAFGTADGTLFIYQRLTNHYDYAYSTVAHNGPIEDMAFDSTHNRLATIGNGCVKIWELNKNLSASNTITTPQRDSIARSVCFVDDGRDLVVGYLDSHEVIGYQVAPWTMKWSQQLLTRMSDFLTYALLPACTDSSDSGYCIAGGDGRSLIVTNLKDGVDIYSLPPGQPLRAFKHNIARNVPLTVSSALGGSIIVVGSDDGHARVYDPHLGIMVCVLQHGNAGSLVQAVDAHATKKLCALVTASSDNDDIKIKVWVMKTAEAEKPHQEPPPSLSLYWTILKYLIITAFISYVNHQLIRLNNLLTGK